MRTVQNLMDLSGRRALVTGGAGHIGRAISGAFVELGARVGVLDYDAQSCGKACESLNAMRRDSAFSLPCDLKNEAQTRRAASAAVKKMEGLDVLVHCAAYVGTSRVKGWAVPFQNQAVKAWDEAMRVNLTAAFVLSQETEAALRRSGRGSVIFIGSIYGVAGPDFRLYDGTSMANPAGYGASKGGLLQLSRYLATHWAPQVRVNMISPGGVWRGQPSAFHERYKKRVPLGRMAMEEDLKGAAVYLASDLSSYVTGHNLMVDGGWTVW